MDDLSTAGETSECFTVTPRPPGEIVEAPGVVVTPDPDLPAVSKTFCYTSDGLPLGGLVSDAPPNTNWLKAVELRRDVDDAVFDPPFPLVASIYDPTPAP